LITHTSGQYYDLVHPLLQKWRAKRGETPWGGPTVVDKTSLPLVFQPGTGWAYGGGLDWAGKIVERVTGKTLDEYMRENIWKPLSMSDVTFWPNTRPELKDRMADISFLSPDGKAVDSQGFDVNYATEECLGGGGCFGSPEDYFKFIQALFQEDPVLLKPKSYRELFKGQLSEKCRKDFKHALQVDPAWVGYLNHNIPPMVDRDYSLAGMIVRDNQPGWMGENTITWGGLTCLVWVRQS
jgi:CubicO group peptidase (beta-lactamase class C family)